MSCPLLPFKCAVMDQVKTLNVASQLKGMPVLILDLGLMLGQVEDAIVDPVEGMVLGLVLLTPGGQERWLAADDVLVFGTLGVVLMTEDAWLDTCRIQASLQGGIRVCGNLLGVEVVTNQGKLLGRVLEVYATEDELRTVYRVAPSRLQLLFGGGFFMAGNLPCSWLEKGRRLIVTAETIERQTFSSLEEAAQCP